MSQPLIIKEVRCPEDPRRLFTKLIQSGDKPVITDDNLIEFACQNCRKSLREQGVNVDIVLHRYNIAGELVETLQRVL